MTDNSLVAHAMGGDTADELLRPIREHRTFILVFIISALLSALVLTYVYSEKYRAETTILFKPLTITEVNHHDSEALGSKTPVATQRNVTQTITGLATSDVVLRRVVTDLHLDVPKPRDLSGPWYVHYYKALKYALEDYGEDAWSILKYGSIIEEDPVDRAVYKLNKAIKITNNDSYVYSFVVSSDTPQKAAATADKLAEVLSSQLKHDDRRSFDQRGGELVGMRDQKLREIQGNEASIRALLAGSGVASIEEELKEITTRLSHLQQQRIDAQADLDQSEAKVVATTEKLRVAMPSPMRDGDPAPPIRGSRISPDDYGKLTSQKLVSEVDSRGLRARLAALEHAYRLVLARSQVLTDIKAQNELLATKLASDKNDYKTLTDAVQELAIQNTAGETELHVQARAEASVLPISPIKVYHVGAAAGLAALVAIGIAYVLDYFGIGLFLPPAPRRNRPRRQPADVAAEPTAAHGAAG